MSATFDNHSAFDLLVEAFEAMDREMILASLRALHQAARTPDDRLALSELGTQGLFRLASLDLDNLPHGTDVAALARWTAEVAADLLDAGAFPDGGATQRSNASNDGTTPVQLAALNSNWGLVRTLVDAGADPAPLFPGLGRSLVNLDVRGVDRALLDLDLKTPPMDDDQRAVLERMKQLSLQRLTAYEGGTPARQATVATIGERLMNDGGFPQEMLDEVLRNAIDNDNWTLIVQLVQRGADPRVQTGDDGDSVLNQMLDAPFSAVWALLERGLPANVLPTDLVQNVLLHSSEQPDGASWQDAERAAVARRLVDMGLPVPTNGLTLIHLVQYPRPMCVQFLLDMGMDPLFSTTKELRFAERIVAPPPSTPAPAANAADRPRFSDRFLRPLFETDNRVHHGYTALHAAAQHGNAQIIGLLLNAGVPVDLKTDDGVTAMHLAAQFGKNGEVIRRLALAGLPFDVTDAKGRTPHRWEAAIALDHLKEQMVLRSIVDGVPTSATALPRTRTRM